MALATMLIDPDAAPLPSRDYIVGKINGADSATTISKASVVTAAARPIEANEVTNDELALTAAKDNLVAMDDVDRGVVLTRPDVGEFPIIAIDRTAAGLLEVDYDDAAIE